MNETQKRSDVNMDDITNYQYYETSLYSIGVPENYLKLLKRIKSSLNISPTVGNIAQLSPHEFQRVKGVGKKYVDELVRLQKILPDLLEKFHLKNGNDRSPSMETDVVHGGQTTFEEKFKTLFANLGLNVNELKKLLTQDLQGGQPESFAKINAEFGKINNSLQKIYSISANTLSTSSIPDSVYLNYYFFEPHEIKALRKLEVYLKQDVDVKALLGIDMLQLQSEKGFGSNTTERLSNIVNIVNKELKQASYETAQKELQRNILVPVNDLDLNLPDLDIVLLEDIEAYLLTLNDQEMDIAMKRWGFHHIQEPLEQIGTFYNTSRERIRQLEALINNRLTKYLRIHPTILWKNFKDHLSPELPLVLPTLSECFSTPETFYYFLEICFSLERGFIKNFIIPDAKRNTFDEYFSFFESPASHEQLSEWIISKNIAEDAASANNFILHLEEKGIVEKNTEGFVPRSLNQSDAVSHVLTKHPEGLPWKDIIRIININKYTKNEISERRMPGHMFDNENVYLSDRGTYRHVKFAKFDGIDIEEILLDILYFFDDSNEESLHLFTDYYQLRKKDINIDYYSLRYVVRNYGEKHGIYFVGQSHVDTVSLHPNPGRVTLKDGILNILKNNAKSMTIAEIAQATRSRNQILTFYTIQALQQEEKVVRVDQKIYTTPEKVFQSIDQQNVLVEINKIIQSTSRIIESDVFREKINYTFSYSYSKYFYASLASLNQKRFSWHCKNQLFCKKPFYIKSMSEIMSEICKLQVGQEENMLEVQKLIWLTKQTFSSAFHNWKFKQQSLQSTEIKEQNVEQGAAH